MWHIRFGLIRAIISDFALSIKFNSDSVQPNGVSMCWLIVIDDAEDLIPMTDASLGFDFRITVVFISYSQSLLDE